MAIVLDRVCISCHHWIYYAEKVNLVSDCSRILDMERVGNHNFITQHIAGSENKDCDALSRLCKSLSGYSNYYPSRPPRLLNLSNKLTLSLIQGKLS